jgi:hypothetical protein
MAINTEPADADNGFDLSRNGVLRIDFAFGWQAGQRCGY